MQGRQTVARRQSPIPQPEKPFFRRPNLESLFAAEGPVNFFAGGVGKTYAGYRIVFIDLESELRSHFLSPGFHKLTAKGSLPLTPEDIKEFKSDIDKAVQNNPWKRKFIEQNDELQL